MHEEFPLDRFREKVSGVHLTVNVGDLVAPQRFVLPYEVIADMDVFHSSMVDRVLGTLDAGLVVDLQGGRVGDWEANFLEDLLQVDGASRCQSCGDVFRFG